MTYYDIMEYQYRYEVPGTWYLMDAHTYMSVRTGVL